MNRASTETAKRKRVYLDAAKRADQGGGFWSSIPDEFDETELWQMLDYWALPGDNHEGNPAQMNHKEHCLFFCFAAAAAGDF